SAAAPGFVSTPERHRCTRRGQTTLEVRLAPTPLGRGQVLFWRWLASATSAGSPLAFPFRYEGLEAARGLERRRAGAGGRACGGWSLSGAGRPMWVRLRYPVVEAAR